MYGFSYPIILVTLEDVILGLILYLSQFYANVIFLSLHCKQNIKMTINLEEMLKSNNRKLAGKYLI
jgi:hypothetical protein